MTRLFACCDVPYFLEHGLAFCRSVRATGNEAGVVLFPNLQIDEKIQQDRWNDFINTYQAELTGPGPGEVVAMHLKPEVFKSFTQLKVEDERALYASIRFLLMSQACSAGPHLIVDIDSIVKKKIPPIPEHFDMGLFLRENNQDGANAYEHLKVAAGIVYVTPKAKLFCDLVATELRHEPIKWFSDQRALYNAYLQVKDKFNIMHFDNQWLDWEFQDDTVIWTGKGNRKYSDPKYVDAKKELES